MVDEDHLHTPPAQPSGDLAAVRDQSVSGAGRPLAEPGDAQRVAPAFAWPIPRGRIWLPHHDNGTITCILDRLFRDRRDAGRVLASLLERYRDRGDVVVLALPRGGVPVAYEVATMLRVPLDVFLVRKLGVPGQEELAMGAIASSEMVVINDDVVRGLGIGPQLVQSVAEREARELARREVAYREGRPARDVRGKVVILVDDGLATGSTMLAAVHAVRALEPARIVVAVPAAPESTCRELAAVVDDVVCATTPSPFLAVGQSYEDFTQTSDDEVRQLLREADRALPR